MALPSFASGRPIPVRALSRVAGALLVGAAGGAVFDRLGMPLAWMLGAMVATTLAVMGRAPIAVPRITRPPVLAVVGAALGASFTAEVLDHLLAFAVPLAGLAGFLMAAGAASVLYLRKVAGLDRATAYFAGMPGGIVEMTVLSGERGGSESMVALCHSARIFLVVATVPFVVEALSGRSIAAGSGGGAVPFSAVGVDDVAFFAAAAVGGTVLARLVRLPAPYMLGPMLASAAVHVSGLTDFAVPTVVVNAAQVMMGATVGCRFQGVSLRLLLVTMGHAAAVTAATLAIAVAFATALAPLSGLSPEALVLGYAPAGLPEMSLAALALGIEVPLVVALHVVRLALVVAFAAVLFRLAR